MRFGFFANPRVPTLNDFRGADGCQQDVASFWRRCAKVLQYALALAVAVVFLPSLKTAEGHEAPLPQLSTRLGGIIGGSPSWNAWKTKFLTVDGRVVDTGNKDVSHSEGQGYGLLLAVAADDRNAFDLMRRWTHAHLGPRADGLFTWRWSPDKTAVPDRNNATDGDILIAWALAEAADHWNAPTLRDEGAAIATAIGRTLVLNVPGHGPVLLPGLYGFDSQSASDGPVVNPSYWLFPAFHRLSQLAPETNWDAVARSGLRLIEDASAAGHPPADWLSLAHGKPRPAIRFPARFGYDALRIPLYLSLAGGSVHSELLRMFPVSSKGISVVSVVDGSVVETARGDGYAAIAGLVRCATERAAYPRALTAPDTTDAYYPATLRLLAQVAALADPKSCLDSSAVSDLRSLEWSPRRPSLPVTTTHVFSISAPFAQRVAVPNALTAVSPIAELSSDFNPAYIAVLPLCIGAGLGFVALRQRRRQATSLIIDDLAAAPRPRVPASRRLASPARELASALPVPAPRPAVLSLNMQPELLPRGGREEGFGDHIELVASASAGWNQHVGVIVLAHCGRTRCTSTDMNRAIAAIRGTLRRGDRVSVIGPTEIGICIGLLQDEGAFAIAAARVANVLATAFISQDLAENECEPPFTSVRALVSSEIVSGNEALSQLRSAGSEAVKAQFVAEPSQQENATAMLAAVSPAPKKSTRKSKPKAQLEAKELKAPKTRAVKQPKIVNATEDQSLLGDEGAPRKKSRRKAPVNDLPVSPSLVQLDAGHVDRRFH